MLLVDEVAGERQVLGQAEFGKLAMSVRELLHARIDLELERTRDERHEALRLSRAAAAEHARGYAGTREWRLNGPTKTYRPALFVPPGDEPVPDREALFGTVEEAFCASRFFVLLDDRQAESLDEMIEIDRTGEATLLLLTPLKGG